MIRAELPGFPLQVHHARRLGSMCGEVARAWIGPPLVRARVVRDVPVLVVEIEGEVPGLVYEEPRIAPVVTAVDPAPLAVQVRIAPVHADERPGQLAQQV